MPICLFVWLYFRAGFIIGPALLSLHVKQFNNMAYCNNSFVIDGAIEV
jgi:hypothetical protein